MTRLRLIAALFVAISTTFITTPAFADSFDGWTLGYNVTQTTDCVQFSYTWGSASKTYPITGEISNLSFSINVRNDITNKIGGNGEVFDSYRIRLDVVNNGQIVDTAIYEEISTKHALLSRTLDSLYTGPATEVNVTLEGIDNGYWGGFYGPIMCGPALIVSSLPQSTPTSTPDTATPTVPPVDASPTPTVSAEPTPTDSPTPEQPQFPQQSMQGTADEGWDLTLTAPDGYKFDAVLFASYGVPDNYTQQWCHAEVSVQKVEEVFVGNTTGTIASSNGVFGDPCGGTYKRLQVVLSYVPLVPVVVPQPEPPVVPTPVEPTPTPTPQPSETQEPPVDPIPEPTVDPSPSPSGKPTPAPTQTQEPVIKPTQDVPKPTPTPEPSRTPETTSSVISSLVAVEDPKSLTTEQVAELVSAAEQVFATAQQGSPEYAAALEALAVAANADDPEIPEELAAVPLVGPVLGAALEAFNDLGNVGADMSPHVRKDAEKVVVSAIIVTQVATAAAVSAAVASASSISTRKMN